MTSPLVVNLVLPLPRTEWKFYYVKGLFFAGTKISLSLAGREDRWNRTKSRSEINCLPIWSHAGREDRFETERSPKRLLQLTISAKFRTIWNSFPTYLCMYVLQNEHGQPYWTIRTTTSVSIVGEVTVRMHVCYANANWKCWKLREKGVSSSDARASVLSYLLRLGRGYSSSSHQEHKLLCWLFVPTIRQSIVSYSIVIIFKVKEDIFASSNLSRSLSQRLY